MRIALCLVAAIFVSTPSFGQSATTPDQPTCAASDSSCKPPSKSDLKRANKLYEKAQKLQHNGEFQEAVENLDRAIELAPKVSDFLSLREMIRQQLVSTHLERGNKLLNAGKNVEAMAEFRQAIEIDPKNQFALQRLRDTLPAYVAPQALAAPLSHALTVVSESRPPVLQPNNVRREFHYKGMSRNLLEQITSSYGLKPMFDDSVQSKPVRMELEEVDFFTAIREAAKLAHVFWVPISSNQVLFVNDTQALRREFERMVARTFYINEATAPQDVTDVVNLLRTIFDIRFVVAQPGSNSVAVRAPEATLDAAARVLETFLSRKPQVNLQIQVFAVNHTLTRQLGISLPMSFEAINVGAAALAALGQGSGNIQDAINQLIASGGINNVDPAGLQALIAQLQNQQQNATLSSLLKTPFATFGGGKTLTAVQIPPLSAHFSLNESNFSSLEDMTLRTAQNNAATLRIGSRYPILNASFAPVFNTSAISQVLQNGSFASPFPSFSYEDIGISVKATPQVLGDNSVNLKLEMSIKALTGQSFNNVPVISNREYNATTSVMDGQPAVVAGMITESEQKSLSGLPGIGRIPILRDATSNRTTNASSDEILIVVTPHIVSPSRKSSSNDEVWVPAT